MLKITDKIERRLLLPAKQVYVLTGASVVFLPGRVPCVFVKTSCCGLVEIKRTTPLKMIPLCIVKASLICSILLSTSEHCLQTPLLVCFISSWNNLFGSGYSDFNLGPQNTLSEVNVVSC